VNDIEIYGVRVNDIKDVREVLAILYAIQEQQKEISERQASITQNAEKLSELVDKLDSMLSRMNEVEQNLEKFVEATRTVNENIFATHDVGVELLEDLRGAREDLSLLVRRCGNAVSEAGRAATAKVEKAVDDLRDELENKILAVVDKAVKETTTKVKSLSAVVKVKAFLVSIVFGVILGYLLYHYSGFLIR